MANHINLFYWLDKTIQIQLSESKDFVSIKDEDGNGLTFFGDDKQILFKAFCEACPQAKIVKP